MAVATKQCVRDRFPRLTNWLANAEEACEPIA